MKIKETLQEFQPGILAGIIGSFIGASVHNHFFKPFTLLGLKSVTIVAFLFALIAIILLEIYKQSK